MKGRHSIGSGPIQPAFAETMQGLAEGIDEILNPDLKEGDTRKVGFILMVFEFGKAKERAVDSRCNYVSTANREDVITLLTKQLSYFKGMPDETPACKA